MKVAFIDLGIMGGNMARNLMKSGHALSFHNRTKAKAAPLLHEGTMWADTPSESLSDTDVVITMLTSPEAVEAMALGKNGFLRTDHPGFVWMDCSTVNPSFSRYGNKTENIIGYTSEHPCGDPLSLAGQE